MTPIERTEKGGITRLTLTHGKVNALDVELLEAITRALEAEAAGDARAVVLTGGGRAFCAGVDLVRLLDGGDAYLDAFFPALVTCFERLADFPKPLVVAANGHAIAGGCVILCAGDRRLVADTDLRVGVTELPVGVPYPGIALEIVRAVVSPGHVRRLVYDGRLVRAAEARDVGFCDEVVAPDLLLTRADELAAKLAAIPPDSFRTTKQQMARPMRALADAHPDVQDQWKSRPVRAAIRAFVERTLRR